MSTWERADLGELRLHGVHRPHNSCKGGLLCDDSDRTRELESDKTEAGRVGLLLGRTR